MLFLVQVTDALFVKVMLLFTKPNSSSGEMFLGPTVCGVVSFLFRDTDPPYIIAIWLAFHGRRLFVSPRWLGITDNVAAAWVVLLYYEKNCPYYVSSAYVLSFQRVCSTRSIPGAYSQQHLYSLMAGYIISAVTSAYHTYSVHTWSSLKSSIHCLSAGRLVQLQVLMCRNRDSLVLVEDRCSSTNWK